MKLPSPVFTTPIQRIPIVTDPPKQIDSEISGAAAETIHFCGVIPGGPAPEDELRTALAPLLRSVGCGFGGLAAGADIVVAEMLLERGAAIRIILPFPPELYLESSVAPAGGQWAERYRACLARSTAQVLATRRTDDLDYALASRRAMGLARLHAACTGSRAWQLAIWHDTEPTGIAGTAADVRQWRASGGATVSVRAPWPIRSRPAAASAPSSVPHGHARVYTEAADRPTVFATPREAARHAVAIAGEGKPVLLDYVYRSVQREGRSAQTVPVRPGAAVATEAFAAEASLQPDSGLACIPSGLGLYAVRVV
jgi:hypothetical protein